MPTRCCVCQVEGDDSTFLRSGRGPICANCSVIRDDEFERSHQFRIGGLLTRPGFWGGLIEGLLIAPVVPSGRRIGFRSSRDHGGFMSNGLARDIGRIVGAMCMLAGLFVVVILYIARQH